MIELDLGNQGVSISKDGSLQKHIKFLHLCEPADTQNTLNSSDVKIPPMGKIFIWAKYRAAHSNDQDCGISESDNWKGAQQCSQSYLNK